MAGAEPDFEIAALQLRLEFETKLAIMRVMTNVQVAVVTTRRMRFAGVRVDTFNSQPLQEVLGKLGKNFGIVVMRFILAQIFEMTHYILTPFYLAADLFIETKLKNELDHMNPFNVVSFGK